MRALLLALVASLYVGLSMAVWRAKPTNRVHRLFALQTLAVAGWTLGNAGLQSSIWLVVSMPLTFASASLIPAAFLIFAVHYPTPRVTPSPLWHHAAVAVGVTFAGVSLTTPLVFYDVRISPEGLFREPGPLYPFFAIYFLLLFSAAFTIFSNKWRRARERERIQLNYFGVGILIAAVGGITTNLIVPWATGRSTLSHLGPYFGIPFIALTAHTIIRHRFLELRVLVHRGLTFAIAALVSLTPVAALVTILWPRLVATFSVAELLLGLAAVLAIGIVIPPTRDAAERLLDEYLYRSRVKPQRLLREAGAAFGRCVDAAAVCAVLRHAALRLAAPEATAIYLAAGDAFVLTSADIDVVTNFIAPQTLPAATRTALTVGPDALVFEEVALELQGELEASGWRVVLPLRVDDEVLGVMALGGRRSGDPFFADHVDTLVALGHAAATSLKTISLLEHRARAERLEDLQRMTDGLAHELGNQLAPIKTFARLIPERHMDERFISDFGRIVGRELDRMEQLLARLKRLAPAAPLQYQLVDLRDPVRHALDVVRVVTREQAIELQEDLGAEPLSVRGDISELDEVFLNLLINAVEAMAPLTNLGGRIVVRMDRTDHEAIAYIEDGGPGIDPLIIDKIFDAFVSTKARGSGLGLTICAGIISRHHGRMSVRNLSSGGAAFTVHLPLAAS